MNLVWYPEAEKEIDEASEYYDDQQLGLGDEFIDEVVVAAAKITEQPNGSKRTILIKVRCSSMP